MLTNLFSSYLIEDTLRLHYRDHSINAVLCRKIMDDYSESNAKPHKYTCFSQVTFSRLNHDGHLN
jgi:hypothetical protein